MKHKHDSEFHFSAETESVPEEFSFSAESAGMGREFTAAPPPTASCCEYPKTDADEVIKADDAEARRRQHHRQLKRMMLTPLVSAVAVVSLVFASLDYDPLGSDFLNTPSDNPAIIETTPAEEPPETQAIIPPQDDLPDETESISGEIADEAFPSLGNLPPNGEVPGYGILNEEFIVIETQTDSTIILTGSARGYIDENGNWQPAPTESVPGISYDAATNTLTLDNYSGPVLNINLMGNSFTLRLIGDNYLEHILVWGFYYGGSLTITGDGSLTVNQNYNYATGIELNAEFSETCLMVDSGVRLDVYGSVMSILVRTTTMEKAIYYLKPLTLTGGVRAGGDFAVVQDGLYASDFGDFQDYTIIEETSQEPSRHVVFQPSN